MCFKHCDTQQKLPIGVLAVFLLLALVGCNGGHGATVNAIPENEEYTQVVFSEDDMSKIFVELPKRNACNAEPLEIKIPSPFEVNGMKCSFACLKRTADNSIAISGTPLETIQWEMHDGQRRSIMVIGACEMLGKTEVVHGFPLVIDETSILKLGDRLIDYDEFERTVLYDFFYYDASAIFEVQDGWLHATEIVFAPSSEGEMLDLSFDYTEDQAWSNSNVQFFSIASDTSGVISGDIASLVEHKGEMPYFSLQVAGTLNGVSIGHAIRINMPDGIPEDFDERVRRENGNIRAMVRLNEGALQFVSFA